MGPILWTIGILLGIAIIVGAMWLGWNRRSRRQVSIPPAPELPEQLGEPNFAIDDAHYVATSVTGNALDRIAVRPLAYRGRAVVEVHPSGVAIGITGERTFFIPRESITLVARTQATIDRAVEPNGLIAVQWSIGPEHSVETYLRVVNPSARAELLDAITAISEPADSAEAAASTEISEISESSESSESSNATREEHK